MAFIWWMLLGLAMGIGGVRLFSWTKEKQYKMKWYEIVLIALGVLLIVFNIEVYVGSIAELERQAATMSLVFMGLPGLILIGAAIGSINRNLKKPKIKPEIKPEIKEEVQA
ncbi:hypothetical protein [Desulfitibacter alkalitolerans]|uniref:hypothetical protein n=1 Tax=Desulfitibacter alkalitolerans TaxID=264641 RepID=UPI000687CBF9|nr:hypothetical protein [Desulfitibacter alkalitolerans]